MNKGRRSQIFIASEGQTDFDITNGSYVLGTGNLLVTVGGTPVDHPRIEQLRFDKFRIPATKAGEIVEANWLQLHSMADYRGKEFHDGGYFNDSVGFDVLKLKRGLSADLPQLDEGEPGVTLDTYQLYVGTPDGNKPISGGGNPGPPNSGDGFVVNVKDHGVVGTGDGTDDWEALQAVLDLVYNTPGGGAIYFPPGRYHISQPLEVPAVADENIVSWIGHSHKSTSIVPLADMDYLVMMRGGSGRVEGIRFRGNDPLAGYLRRAKVSMKATDISDKIFSNCAFSWAKVHGLHITREGNNNLCIIDQSCEFDQNGVISDGVDGSGTADVVTFTSFNPILENVEVGSFLRVGNDIYHIDAFTANTISISPDLSAPLTAGTTYYIHVGNGLHMERGSDNNVYGIYDAHFVGNAGVGLMSRGLYGQNIQGGNFDYNGIAGLLIGSGMVNVTPAYSSTVHHAYFENNGYCNIILDYPKGLSIIEPMLADSLWGVSGGVDSVLSIRGYDYDYNYMSIILDGYKYDYSNSTSSSLVVLANEESRNLNVYRATADATPMRIMLPPPPTHAFIDTYEIFVDSSGGKVVEIRCDFALVNDKTGTTGVNLPAGKGYRAHIFYSHRRASWMVSHTTPLV